MQQLGIDIGGSSVKTVLLRDGAVLWTRQSSAYSRPTTAQLIAAIQETIQTGTLEANGVGLCVPGLLDEQRRSVTISVNVPGLLGITLHELMSRAIGNSVGRIHIVNDANAAAVDVVRSRQLGGRAMVIAMGTGVGMAVLDDGKPLVVEGDSSGHLGQIDVSIDSNPPIGPDGGAGSLEAYIGVPALLRQYGTMDAFFKTATPTDTPFRALARAIRIGQAIYRPHHVILVGGVGIRLTRFTDDLKKLIDTDLTNIARKDWTLSCGDSDFHAAIGAARLAE